MFQSVVDFFAEDKIQTVFSDITSYKFKYIAIAIAVFATFVLLKKIFAKYVFKIILKLVNKTKFNADTQIVAAFQKPVTNFFEVLGVYFALKILIVAGIPIDILDIDKIFSSAIIILISWGLYNLTGESSLLFERMHKAYDVKVDKILFPFISKTLKLILLALVITIIAEKWGYNIQGFVTGLGLGGLAFALAAKDAAANIIAGISIIVDKPFTIGDWINSDILEGTIENISFRTTKIRTIDEALIIVPNSKLTTEAVTNYSRRGKRRVSLNLELNYRTSREKLESCVANIKNMLENHPQVNKEGILVRFDKFSASSLDILICCFADTPDFDEYFKVKENINFEIVDILHQEGISMALQSTSVYVEKLPNRREQNDINLEKANLIEELPVKNINKDIKK
ncbi:mechanosensitive ion channel family protein [Clostridium algoriphilum]|uniref:mechanosensitive ion channel family protein n=1 Tax=Clostridium algoriphilum TaxID=198347 RepID=UPI001CF5C062|nr:mechanosensitive ion channel family protein [Clostridium algoriphilum]MCB2295512.1 mechanosensitive ion channel family protein [Clostridium algoriphilum]